MCDAPGVARQTADDYDRLLTNLFVIDSLPAWSTRRLQRLSKSRKRYLIDPALLQATLRLSRASILRDGVLLGRLIETFVLAHCVRSSILAPLDRASIIFVIETSGGKSMSSPRWAENPSWRWR